MNTLANHDFVPHSGRNVTRSVFARGVKEAFNLNEEMGAGIFDTGAAVNPIPNATVSTLLCFS